MARYLTTPLLAIAASLGACGHGGGTSDPQALDCDFVQSDNCWKQLVDQIALCAPDPEATGVFTADRTACEYADGTRVEFDTALPTSIPSDYKWRFTVLDAEGSPCVRWDDQGETAMSADLEVTAGGDTVAMWGTPSGLTLECPDGSAYYTDAPLSVITGCGAPRDYGLPVTTIRTAPGYVGLAIALGEEPSGADIEVPLFACETAQ